MSTVKRLELRPAGMFSNVNEVVDNLIKADSEGYRIDIDWSNSTYYDDSMKIDPWNYYFEDVHKTDDRPVSDSVEPIFRTGDEVLAPHERADIPTDYSGGFATDLPARKVGRTDDGQLNLLLPPKNRQITSDYIHNYINLKDHIRKKLLRFKQENFDDRKVIGIHLRGPNGLHGGSAYYRDCHPTENRIPFSLLFDKIDKSLDKYPDAFLFVCSDADPIVERVSNRYGDRVFSYDATRWDTGEMHVNLVLNPRLLYSYMSSINSVTKLRNIGKRIYEMWMSDTSNHKLGEDILIIAFLLSESDHLIHGVSNVTNFALGRNPDLKSTFLFKQELQELKPDIWEWEV